jgi:hypothetical protein
MAKTHMPFSEAFRILQIPKNLTVIPPGTDQATAKEISGKLQTLGKSQFRKLAPKCHPDKFPGDKAKEAQFKELNAAKEVVVNIIVHAKPFRRSPVPRGGVGVDILTGQQLRYDPNPATQFARQMEAVRNLFKGLDDLTS